VDHRRTTVAELAVVPTSPMGTQATTMVLLVWYYGTTSTRTSYEYLIGSW